MPIPHGSQVIGGSLIPSSQHSLRLTLQATKIGLVRSREEPDVVSIARVNVSHCDVLYVSGQMSTDVVCQITENTKVDKCHRVVSLNKDIAWMRVSMEESGYEEMVHAGE